MRLSTVCALLLVSMLLSGCFGKDGLSCEGPGRYATSDSAPPVRVPDGLSVPDESQALQIPPGESLELPAEDEPNPCLERPPEFFDEDDDEATATD